jgi:undecaprenyl-diphosphatase
MRNLLHRLAKSSLFRIIAGFAIAALFLWAVGTLVTSPYKWTVAVFDSNIRHAMRQIQSPMWSSLLLTLTKLGSTWGLVIVGSIVGLALIVQKRFRSLELLILLMAGQAVLHHGFKWLIARPRPPALLAYKDIESSSFPSGHAIGILCLFSAAAWMLTEQVESPAIKALIAIFAGLIIFLVGMSRVYIGIHYPTDVLAGFIGAGIWTVAVLSLDRRKL